MKYSKYFLIIALFGIVTSCSDFLDRTNPNEPDNVTFWVNEEQLKNALPPCYEALQKDYLVNWSESTAETVMWGNITSGLSKVSGGKHSYTDGFPFTTYWTGAYSYIYRCNNFLDNYNKAQVAQNKKDVYAAEVKTIRALMYFYLTTFWGDVPWVGEVIQPEDAYIERTPREKVIDQLVEDLKWAAERMPEERYTGDKLGRLDRWGALAILARIALQNERWELSRMIRRISKPSYIAFLYLKSVHKVCPMKLAVRQTIYVSIQRSRWWMLICVQTVNLQKPDWNIIKRLVCRPHHYTSRLKSIMLIISKTGILE